MAAGIDASHRNRVAWPESMRSNPSIAFHSLPLPEYLSPDPDPFLQMLDLLRLTVPSLLAFLRSLPSVATLVLDLFCIDYTSSVGDLAAFPHLPHHFATTEGDFKDMGKTLLRFPGVRPRPPDPAGVLHRAADRERWVGGRGAARVPVDSNQTLLIAVEFNRSAASGGGPVLASRRALQNRAPGGGHAGAVRCIWIKCAANDFYSAKF